MTTHTNIVDLNYARRQLRIDEWGHEAADFNGHERIRRNLVRIKSNLNLKNSQPISNSPINPPPSLIDSTLLNELKNICEVHTDNEERIFHAAGRSYFDVIRLKMNLLTHFPDAIAYPKTENQVSQLLAFAKTNRLMIIPFGGGSSVVGGVNVPGAELLEKKYQGVVCVDLTNLNKLIKMDPQNYLATFEAGIYGPHLEKILAEQNFTLGHYPQSFEYSTLGGWVATRSAGQFSNYYGRIENLVYQIRIATPQGTIESGYFPATASGPDLLQLLIGSEGTFGIITRVTVKVRPIPNRQYFKAMLFKNFSEGRQAVAAISQKNLPVLMCRLSDEEETKAFQELKSDLPVTEKKSLSFKNFQSSLLKKFLKAMGFSKPCLLIWGFNESDQDCVIQVKNIARSHGGLGVSDKIGQDWFRDRFNLPYLRRHLINEGIGVDTMETSVPYTKVEAMRAAVYRAFASSEKTGKIFCHLSHSYENGVSLYFTALFEVERQDPVAQWQRIKNAISEAIIHEGGTISHHHGIGLDHVPFLRKQLGPLATHQLKTIKDNFDSEQILNPGKLI